MSSILNATTTSGLVTSADNSGSLQLQTNNGTTAVTIDTSQNVSVGTTTALATASGRGNITINGSSNAILAFGSGGTLKGYVYQDSTTMYLVNSSTGTMNFEVNGTERMRIDSSGNLLVGKTAENNTSPGITLMLQQSSTAPLQKMVKTYSGSINSLANYHNGTYVGGIDFSNTATSFPTSSDIRLKKNIEDCQNALNKINQIRVVSHDWKDDDSHVEYGVIAQELEPIAPQAVKRGDDGETIEQTWGVDYSKLVPMLTKAIQELKAELDATKAEVQALKGVA